MARNGERGASDARVESASLRYVSDNGRGIRRLTSKTGFRYLDSDGRTIRDAHEVLWKGCTYVGLRTRFPKP